MAPRPRGPDCELGHLFLKSGVENNDIHDPIINHRNFSYIRISALFLGKQTSTGLYRSCAALASFSSTSDLILFEAVIFGYFVEKVRFCYVSFGLTVWTNRQY